MLNSSPPMLHYTLVNPNSARIHPMSFQLFIVKHNYVEIGNTRSKQLLMTPTEQQLRTALEWIGMFKGLDEFFNIKISDLFEYTIIMERMPVRGLYT